MKRLFTPSLAISDFWVLLAFLHLCLKMSLLLKNDTVHIRDVWNHNLDQEMALIRDVVLDFPYVAMDTEFPGIVVKPLRTFRNANDLNYESLKENVNMSKLIQMGFTFMDANGNLPMCGTDKYCIWQFNFREFDINDDVYATDSIELLNDSGINFKKFREEGVDVVRFGELLMSSGVVCTDDVSWVMFHSGYDFGYLVKLLTFRSLPDTSKDFFDLLNVYFPVVYDVKHMMAFCDGLYGGLSKLAELLGVERIGSSHQAGSDSLLTVCTFRKLRERHITGSLDKYAGVLHGLGVESEQDV